MVLQHCFPHGKAFILALTLPHSQIPFASAGQVCRERCCAVSRGSAATTARVAPSPSARAGSSVPGLPSLLPGLPVGPCSSSQLHPALPIPRYSLHGDLPWEQETTSAVPFTEPVKPASTLSFSSSVLCCLWAGGWTDMGIAVTPVLSLLGQ